PLHERQPRAEEQARHADVRHRRRCAQRRVHERVHGRAGAQGNLARTQGQEEEMKAPAFAYAKPASLAAAFDLLANPNAKVLAGGQSLIPSLNMRFSSPELLVDITGLPGLSEIGVLEGTVRI